MTTGLIFGTFDGLHAGHEMMLRETRMRCDRVVACVPEDELVQRLKEHAPTKTFAERAYDLLQSGLVEEVLASDRELGTFGVITTVKPDVILLGYDQIDLGKSLMEWLTANQLRIPIIRLQPFEPDNYKSSILRFK